MTDLATEGFLKVLELEAQALKAAHTHFLSTSKDPKNPIERLLQHLNQTLDKRGKIVVTGVGKSGKIAQKIAATLTSTGSLAVFIHPTEALHGDMGVIQKEDTILALSYTGNSSEIVQLVEILKDRVSGIISMTSRKDSRLGELSQYWLDCSVEQEACPHNLAPTTSTTLMLALGDAIAVSLMKLRKFEPNDFAKNHPGGALGKKMTLLVSDLMHSGDKLAVVQPDALAPQVIEISTRKKLGGVLVVDQGKLLGLITDGDIRRALSHQAKFFTLTAANIMTAKPITVSANTLAKDAIAIMENRESQISVLPVVNSDGKAVGLIRLHDLIRTL